MTTVVVMREVAVTVRWLPRSVLLRHNPPITSTPLSAPRGHIADVILDACLEK